MIHRKSYEIILVIEVTVLCRNNGKADVGSMITVLRI